MENELEKIGRILVNVRDAVREKMNAAGSVEESDSLYLQLLEINHRLLMISQILFDRDTDAFSGDVQAIREVTKTIKDAIEGADRLRDAIGGVKELLGIVDKVIDAIT